MKKPKQFSRLSNINHLNFWLEQNKLLEEEDNKQNILLFKRKKISNYKYL